MTLTETFGANLRNQRKSKKLTQAELSEKIGVSSEMVSKIERGIAAPSFKTIEKLASAIGVQEASFFNQGYVATIESERSHILNKINTALSRMNSDQLVRTHKILLALID